MHRVAQPKPSIQKPPPRPPASVISATSARSNTKAGGVRANSRDKAYLLKSDILSKEEQAKLAKEKKEKMDELKKKYSKRIKSKGPSSRTRIGSHDGRSQDRGSSNGSQSRKVEDVTKCTRDEDINIEEFMREDMKEINKEEDRVQRELMQLHQKNLHRHAVVV